MTRHIRSDGAPAPMTSYSHGVMAGQTLYVAGQLGLDPDTGEVPADVAEETSLAMSCIEAIVADAGLSMDDVARTTIYVTDFDDYLIIDEVYSTFFTPPYPARATVRVAGLLKSARVEIDAVAVGGG